MTVELSAPPKSKERRKYKSIIDQVVAADGEWLRITHDEIAPGSSVAAKQTRIWQAASIRGVKIQTTAQEGAIFIRLQKEQA